MTKSYNLSFTNFKFRAGVDISKNHFALFHVDLETGELIRKDLNRKAFVKFYQELPRGVIAIEACSTSKYWARVLEGMGHKVLLLNPRSCKAFVPGCKSDKADAEGIYRAMEYVRPIPRPHTVSEQEIHTILMLRKFTVAERTRYINATRAHLAEFGQVLPLGVNAFLKGVSDCINELEAEGKISTFLILKLRDWHERVKALSEEIDRYDKEINARVLQSQIGELLTSVPGVGPITAAWMMTLLSDPSAFDGARSFAAYLGLVPSHTGTGGKTINGGITKRGDVHVRSLLVQGALSVIMRKEKTPWLKRLLDRMESKKKAAVALAARTARILWAIAASGKPYDPKICH